jgi:hypothetical protein
MTKVQLCYRITFITLLITAWGGTAWQAYKAGLTEGINKYHGQCYNIGGVIIDSEGKAIGCKPLGQISQEELQRFKNNENKPAKPLDKSVSV